MLEKKNAQQFKKTICQGQHCQEQYLLKSGKMFLDIHTFLMGKRTRMENSQIIKQIDAETENSMD